MGEKGSGGDIDRGSGEGDRESVEMEREIERNGRVGVERRGHK
jgi:hypothetical protein